MKWEGNMSGYRNRLTAISFAAIVDISIRF